MTSLKRRSRCRSGKDLRLPTAQLAVAGVHPEQVGGEQSGLVATRPGANLDDDVSVIARVARHEQRS
jgi:hypothetical protein